MSTKRKASRGNPARLASTTKARALPHTPEGVMAGLTHSTAERVLEGLLLLEKLAKDYPELPHLYETRVAYEVASLALIEAWDVQQGRVPQRLQRQPPPNPVPDVVPMSAEPAYSAATPA